MKKPLDPPWKLTPVFNIAFFLLAGFLIVASLYYYKTLRVIKFLYEDFGAVGPNWTIQYTICIGVFLWGVALFYLPFTKLLNIKTKKIMLLASFVLIGLFAVVSYFFAIYSTYTLKPLDILPK